MWCFSGAHSLDMVSNMFKDFKSWLARHPVVSNALSAVAGALLTVAGVPQVAVVPLLKLFGLL